MKEVKQKEVLSEFIQQSHDPQYAVPVLDKASIQKKVNFGKCFFKKKLLDHLVLKKKHNQRWGNY